MSTSRITRLFVISLLACVTGGLLVAVGWLASPDDVFIRNGAQISGLRETGSAVALFGLGLIGAVVLAGAAITGFVAWIGALLNTAAFERKRWFVAIALLGVLNCGLLGVFAYVVARPGGTRQVPVGPTVRSAASPA
jgi:hypothetical protein